MSARIDLFIQQSKLAQEFLMLLQLKIKDNLAEVRIEQFTLVLLNQPHNIIPSHFLCGSDIYFIENQETGNLMLAY